MIHEMRLHSDPFNKIKAGTKIIEIRLYDEKRQLIKAGDTIVFTSRANEEDKIETIVEKLYIFSSFNDLYKNFSSIELGYDKGQVASPSDMKKYYSKEEQKQYGVVGIKIKKIKG